jgi:hypothetical protein
MEDNYPYSEYLNGKGCGEDNNGDGLGGGNTGETKFTAEGHGLGGGKGDAMWFVRIRLGEGAAVGSGLGDGKGHG